MGGLGRMVDGTHLMNAVMLLILMSMIWAAILFGTIAGVAWFMRHTPLR